MNIYLIGCTSIAKICKQILIEEGHLEKKFYYIDDSDRFKSEQFDQSEVIHGINHMRSIAKDEDLLLNCIGTNHMSFRAELFSKYMNEYKFPMVVDKTAIVNKSSTIGQGCMIFSGTIVGYQAQIGMGSIIWDGTIVEHECEIAPNVYIGPGTTISGMVSIGQNTIIGSGVTILPYVTIGQDCIIGAGSVVTKNLANGEVAFGVPARKR